MEKSTAVCEYNVFFSIVEENIYLGGYSLLILYMYVIMIVFVCLFVTYLIIQRVFV